MVPSRQQFRIVSLLATILIGIGRTTVLAQPGDPDVALQPAHVVINPWPSHIPPTKRQGVPGIECTAHGRLWVVYGRDVESQRNYQVLVRSDNDGLHWSHPQVMILPPVGVRAMSAAVWIDPLGRLWLFWGQSFGQQDGRYGIWTIMTDEPDASFPRWSEPRRLGDGIMLNKPTVLSSGDWLFASSVWKADDSSANSADTHATSEVTESWSRMVGVGQKLMG